MSSRVLRAVTMRRHDLVNLRLVIDDANGRESTAPATQEHGVADLPERYLGPTSRLVAPQGFMRRGTFADVRLATRVRASRSFSYFKRCTTVVSVSTGSGVGSP
jgi:hypothetical protein